MQHSASRRSAALNATQTCDFGVFSWHVSEYQKQNCVVPPRATCLINTSKQHDICSVADHQPPYVLRSLFFFRFQSGTPGCVHVRMAMLRWFNVVSD